MTIKLKDISTKLYEQEDGTEIGKKIIDNYKNKKSVVILDFEGISSVNTAFFNAILSAIITFDGKQESYKKYFKFKNTNNSIISMFALSLNYSKHIS